MKLLLVVMISFYSCLLFADGKVIFVKGKVTSQNKQLKKGSLVKEGQILESGKDSLGIIKLNEGTTFKLNPESKIEIKRIAKKKKGTWLGLLKGNVFLKYDKKKKNGLRVSAKGVSMGVRGTEFFASYNNDDVWMCVHKGKVLVKAKGDKKATLVKQGEGVLVKKGKETTDPKAYPWTEKLNWNMDPEKGKTESEIEIEDAYSDPLDQEYD